MAEFGNSFYTTFVPSFFETAVVPPPAGPTVYDASTLAAIEAISPSPGDLGFPTDSGYILTGGNSGWLYSWEGYTVQKPPTTGWTLLNTTTTTQSTVGGVQVLNVETGPNLTQRGTSRAAATGNAYIFGLSAPVLGSDSQILAGFYESGTGRAVITTFRSSGYTGAPDARVQGHTSLTTGSTATYADNADGPGARMRRFIKLEWSGTTLNYYVGMSPQGPWLLMETQGQGTYFTTAPDTIYWGAFNALGGVLPITLFHYSTEAA